MADTTDHHHQFGHLPGFRFHPTEEELLEFYLKQIIFGKHRPSFDVIEFLNIYQHDPWDLPDLAKNGEREWYFFVPRDRKNGGCGGGRPNRTTGIGYWKATGSDRRIFSLSSPKRLIGLRKTLVFYRGRAPRGTKTDWVMNEYRLPDNSSLPMDVVVCKIYRKATSLKVLEQRAEEEETKNFHMKNNYNNNNNATSTPNSNLMAELEDSFCTQIPSEMEMEAVIMKKETSFEDEEEEEEVDSKDVATVATTRGLSSLSSSSTSIQIPKAFEMLTDLQVPKMNMDWTQDQFWSPWLLNLITTPSNVLNL